MSKVHPLLSRKLWMTIAAVAMLVLKAPNAKEAMLAVLGYVVAQGAVDLKGA